MSATPSRIPVVPGPVSRKTRRPRLAALEPAPGPAGDPAFELAQALPLQVTVVDVPRRAYVFLNRRALTWLGYPPATPAEQVPFLSHTHPEDRHKAEDALERLEGLDDDDVLDLEFRSHRGDGAWRHLLCRMSVYRRDAGGRVLQVAITAQDITDRLALGTRMRQAQKMQEVGQLAGGVAHDFNNLLTVMLGYAETLTSRCVPGDPIRDDAEQIVRAGRRAALLTQQLLSAAKRQESQPVALDLDAVCRSVGALLRRLLPADIELRYRPARGLRRALGDPALIEQVLMNLVVNARDAMPDGGRLLVTTGNVDVLPGDAWHRRGAAPGPYVRLRVADTGIGIDAAICERIFEPFFTTKPPHRGTGLGLSVVHDIVREAGGAIAVATAPSRGARFDLLFPAAGVTVRTVQEEGEAAAGAHGLETVLLVEDNDAVRRLAREGLEAYGYHVLEAASAEQALALTHDFMRRIHLAVTDLSLPGMSGGALARVLAEQLPETRVLFVSGYAEDPPSAAQGTPREWHYLQKPFTPAALARAVRRALTPSPASP